MRFMRSPESMIFHEKPKKELKEQLGLAEDILEGGKESSLTPPSLKERGVLGMTIDEIKQKYTRRYEMYLPAHSQS